MFLVKLIFLLVPMLVLVLLIKRKGFLRKLLFIIVSFFILIIIWVVFITLDQLSYQVSIVAIILAILSIYILYKLFFGKKQKTEKLKKVLNPSDLNDFSSKFYDPQNPAEILKYNKEKEEIKQKTETEIQQLKEEEYNYTQKLINNAENGDHKSALELSNNIKDNNIEAYYWNLVAEALGSQEAVKSKPNLLSEMSDLQINIAQERFKKWLNNKIGINVSNNYAPFKTQSSFGGYVYIMTCDKWIEDGLVKIGKSNNIERRLNEAQKEVQGTYSPNPPIIKVYHHQFSRYYNELEKHIHLKLQDRRFKSDTSTATEFFRLTPEEAKAELDIAVREIEEKMTS